jgi:hypothetical protein
MKGVGNRAFVNVTQCRDISIVVCCNRDRVTDREVSKLAVGLQIALGLVGLAEPRQLELEWAALMIRERMMRDEGFYASAAVSSSSSL